jgi:hypothetical protein
MPHPRLLTVGLALTALVIGGCGSGDEAEDSSSPAQPGAGHTATVEEKPDAARVAPSHCPSGLPSCRSTAGRVVYVERVDPDGDGDAHFVIADPHGITLPGLTAIDVRRGLRPKPLPAPGDLVSVAGPVQTGSYGQSQIHALELHVAVAGKPHRP